MKLVTEQIHYLRNRKKELLSLIESYTKQCQSREIGGLDGLHVPHFFDYQEQAENSRYRSELIEIDQMLQHSEFQTERNFAFIDIGTIFSVDFGDGDIGKSMLVDSHSSISGGQLFSSIDSDFGKSVLGKKEGDQVSYKVTSNGNTINISIQEIDRVKDHYLHFIREQEYTKRVCGPFASELQRLKTEDPEEYRRRHELSASQLDLLKEELTHLKGNNKRRRNFIIKQLMDAPIADYPTGPTIQVGSNVEIMLQDGDQEPTIHSFEFINQAVSTEIEGDYVERITTLGNAIYGLKEGDTFLVRRQHQPSIKGVVTKVQNYDVKRRVR